MSIEEDRAVQAAQDTVVRETDNGYRVLGSPDESVTHQHDIDRIPQFDVTQEMISDSGDTQEAWLTYGGNYEMHRYTTADLIGPDNVSDLEVEYDISVGSGSSMEGSPIIVPGDPTVMYQSNGPNHIKAIDARNGEVLWSYTYAVPSDVVLCCDDNNRGPAVWQDKVYMTTLDSGSSHSTAIPARRSGTRPRLTTNGATPRRGHRSFTTEPSTRVRRRRVRRPRVPHGYRRRDR